MKKIHHRKSKLGGHRFVATIRKSTGKIVKRQLSDVLFGPATCSSSHFGPTAASVLQQHAVDQVPDKPTTSKYYIAKSIQMAQWEKIRPTLMQAAFDSAAPVTTKCALCQQDCPNIVVCDSCGPTYFVCETCAHADHRLRPFHSLCIWTVSIFYNMMCLMC